MLPPNKSARALSVVPPAILADDESREATGAAGKHRRCRDQRQHSHYTKSSLTMLDRKNGASRHLPEPKNHRPHATDIVRGRGPSVVFQHIRGPHVPINRR